jgi:predicted amidohydrolase YtcJ
MIDAGVAALDGAAELLIVGADVRTMDPSRPRARALALAHGRVLAAGSEAQLEGLRRPHTQVLDAAGATVLPGLIDAHGHFGHVARSMATAVDCRTPPVRSVADILDRARTRARESPPGTWILLQGANTAWSQARADWCTIDPHQRITLEEALAMYTRHAAHAGHWETSRGILAPGLLGDAIVLDRPLGDVPDEEIADVRVAHTIVAGELVYSEGVRVCERGQAPGPARGHAPGLTHVKALGLSLKQGPPRARGHTLEGEA